VMAAERSLGRTPTHMPPSNKGYDIESRAADGSLLFIQVKERSACEEEFTITRSEIAIAHNKPGQHIVALVEVGRNVRPVVRYVQHAFEGLGDLPFGRVSVNLKWAPYLDGVPNPRDERNHR
jgi:hypothetical protein